MSQVAQSNQTSSLLALYLFTSVTTTGASPRLKKQRKNTPFSEDKKKMPATFSLPHAVPGKGALNIGILRTSKQHLAKSRKNQKRAWHCSTAA